MKSKISNQKTWGACSAVVSLNSNYLVKHLYENWKVEVIATELGA